MSPPAAPSDPDGGMVFGSLVLWVIALALHPAHGGQHHFRLIAVADKVHPPGRMVAELHDAVQIGGGHQHEIVLVPSKQLLRSLVQLFLSPDGIGCRLRFAGEYGPLRDKQVDAPGDKFFQRPPEAESSRRASNRSASALFSTEPRGCGFHPGADPSYRNICAYDWPHSRPASFFD